MRSFMVLNFLFLVSVPGFAQTAQIYQFKELSCMGTLVPGRASPDWQYSGLRIVNHGSRSVTDILGQTWDRPLEWFRSYDASEAKALREVKSSDTSESVSSALKTQTLSDGSIEVYFENWGKKELDLTVTSSDEDEDHLVGNLLGDFDKIEYTLTCIAQK